MPRIERKFIMTMQIRKIYKYFLNYPKVYQSKRCSAT